MHKTIKRLLVITLLFSASISWASATPKGATTHTKQFNTAVQASTEKQMQAALKGRIAPLPMADIVAGDGRVAWSVKAYDFLAEDTVPDTVNPSLWRQAQLNITGGLFKVAPGIYQVRGLDLAAMTIVQGDTGLIIIDPLLTPATAQAALALYRKHVEDDNPVKAVVYTHSHVDHFGGVKGIVSQAEVDEGEVEIYAPKGFLQEAVSENVLAGRAMVRRAKYMYGTLLEKSAKGHVDMGIGKGIANGPITLIAPTHEIVEDGVRTIDGVEVDFRLALNTEAPAEIYMYFPKQKVLNTAELTTQTMHNLYTLRGAAIRDAIAWSRAIDNARHEFGQVAEVLIDQHSWPVWGQEKINDYLAVQRDTYKYIHDQTVRLMNHGLQPDQIANTIALPPELEEQWSSRGHYGTLQHNARAVYQKYMGWYDSNPANLNPLPSAEEAEKFVDYMGGADKILTRAKEDFERGEYRWVVSVLNKLIYAEPNNQEARQLAADAHEQLGYQAASGPWRDEYLSAAFELRGGTQDDRSAAVNADLLRSLETGMVFDLFGTRMNGEKAAGKTLRLHWRFTDTEEAIMMRVQNAALTWLANVPANNADAELELTRETLNQVLLQQISFKEAMQTGAISVAGDPSKVGAFFALMDQFKGEFNIIEPPVLPGKK